MSNGASAGREATPQAEMAAFDALPRALRDLLNEWTLNWSALDIASQPAGGRVMMGSIPVNTPDRRGDYVAKIIEQEARFPRPLFVTRQRGPLRR